MRYINKSTLSQIDKICKITETIFNVYERLIRLEKENKKNTNEYNNSLEFLQMLLEEEKELYSFFENKTDEAAEAVNFLRTISEYKLGGVIPVIGNNNTWEILQFRIIKRLDFIARFNPNYIKKYVSEELLDKISKIPNNIKQLASLYQKLENEKNRRIAILLLDKSFETIPDKIRVFYLLSFYNPNFENDNIKNRFTIPSNSLPLKKAVSNNDEYDNELYEKALQEFGMNITVNAMLTLLEYEDYEIDYSNQTKYGLNLLNFQAGMFFILLNPSQYEKICEYFQAEINSSSYLIKHEQDQRMRNIIKYLLQKSKQNFYQANKENDNKQKN